MEKQIKVNVAPQAGGGLLVSIDDPRWSVKLTSAGILIRPVPGAALSEELKKSIEARNPTAILAALRAELRGMRVHELRDLCGKAELSKDGRKPELIERLVKHAREHGGKSR